MRLFHFVRPLSHALLLNLTSLGATQCEVPTLFSHDESNIHAELAKLDAKELVRAVNDARRLELDLDPHYEAAFTQLSDHVNQLSRQLREIELLPFECLYVLDDSNVEDFLLSDGAGYSQLKYGNPQAINTYADRLAERIRSHFGPRLHTEPWVLASAAYYRTPNAASHLGQIIADKLKLPQADIRVRDTYSGEFGALTSSQLRRKIVEGTSIYVSNPDRVEGCHVIYIDDVYVSGAHLVDHCDRLMEEGALSVHPFAVFDVFSKTLTIEKALNYAKISIDEPEPLLEILNDPEAPILTRTVKYLLRLEEAQLRFILDQLQDERIFSLFEAADAERYDRFEAFRPNIAILKEAALQRHLARMVPEEDLSQRSFKMMLLDYDGTLAATLQPLSEPMMNLLISYIEHGVEVAIVTMQPIGERGVLDYTIAPLKDYLARCGKPASLLQKLHLFPSEGAYYYRCGREGTIDVDRPIYNLGFPLQERSSIYSRLSEQINGLYSKVFYRGAYVSYHFATLSDFETAKQRLQPVLDTMQPQLILHRKQCSDPNKIVLHVRLEGLSKAIARNHMLLHVKSTLERRLGHRIPREQILVVGDRLGQDPEEGSDTAMFVFGGVNLAVGDDACAGAYTHAVGKRERGTYDFLQANQAFLADNFAASTERLHTLQCEALEFDLENRPWTEAYALRAKLKQLQDFVAKYTEKRLRDARSELELKALHSLTESNQEEFFSKKVYFHKQRQEHYSWAELYSLMKYGDIEAIDYFAKQLAAIIGNHHSRSDCAIAVPAGYMDEVGGAVKASLLLGQALANELDVELIAMELTREQEINYCALDDALTRFDLAMSQYAQQHSDKQQIFLVDDAVVSGATLWAIMAALGQSGAMVTPVCIVDVLVDDFSTELTLNDSSNDDEETILSILQDPQAAVTTRTLNKFLQWDEPRIHAALDSLGPDSARSLIDLARASCRITEKLGPRALDALDNWL